MSMDKIDVTQVLEALRSGSSDDPTTAFDFTEQFFKSFPNFFRRGHRRSG